MNNKKVDSWEEQLDALPCFCDSSKKKITGGSENEEAKKQQDASFSCFDNQFVMDLNGAGELAHTSSRTQTISSVFSKRKGTGDDLNYISIDSQNQQYQHIHKRVRFSHIMSPSKSRRDENQLSDFPSPAVQNDSSTYQSSFAIGRNENSSQANSSQRRSSAAYNGSESINHHTRTSIINNDLSTHKEKGGITQFSPSEIRSKEMQYPIQRLGPVVATHIQDLQCNFNPSLIRSCSPRTHNSIGGATDARKQKTPGYKGMPEIKSDNTIGGVDTPSEIDVLFGRGAGSNKHPGNIRFRDIVAQMKPAYRGTSSKLKKKKMSEDVLSEVHSYGGRFLLPAEDEKTHQPCWVVASYDVSRGKASQALREKRNDH